MKPDVQQAIVEIKSEFPGHAVEAHPDGEGGAFVRVNTLSFGPAYKPDVGWVTFRIGFNYPHADVYPHYVLAELERHDGRPLGEAFNKQNMQMGPFTGSATMVSRRSKRWNPAQDTAALKLAKVLDWIRSRS